MYLGHVASGIESYFIDFHQLLTQNCFYNKDKEKGLRIYENSEPFLGMQYKIDITHLNSIDPIKRHIVITTYITAFMEPILCVSSFLHDSKLAA